MAMEAVEPQDLHSGLASWKPRRTNDAVPVCVGRPKSHRADGVAPFQRPGGLRPRKY